MGAVQPHHMDGRVGITRVDLAATPTAPPSIHHPVDPSLEADAHRTVIIPAQTLLTRERAPQK
jgi:hypothetical protein